MVDTNVMNDDGRVIPRRLAERIETERHIACRRDNEKLYVYNNEKGIYENDGAESMLKEDIERKLEEAFSRRHMNETLEILKIHNYKPKEAFETEPHRIAVDNGILNLKTKELEDHNPEEIHITKIPWRYDPEADCPKIKQFISELVHEDDIKVIQEMFGYCLYKDYPISKAFMLLGEGANGKSTLLDLLEAFLGEENVATPSLQDLLDNRFTKIDLYGKLANIHADLSAEKLESTGTFKMLTGGDTIYGEKKYENPIQFKNHAKLIYSANELPKTDDRTKAFFRRWVVIEFPNQFTTDNEETDPNLPESIIDEEEMSGLLNWSIKGLQRVLEQNGFSHTKSRDDIKQKWMMETDSLRAFLNMACEVEEGARGVPKKTFYNVYQEFCKDHNIYFMKKGPVTKKLPTINPMVQLHRPEVDGERVRCWKNLRLKESFIKENDYVQDVQSIHTTFFASTGEEPKKGSDKPLDILDTEITGSEGGGDNPHLEVIKFLRSQDEKRVEVGRIRDEFGGDTWDLLNKLEEKGVVYEPKHGEWVLSKEYRE